ncbi:hypothetical protein DSECCO2_640800 [anaerobic digester metagenome]
MAVLDPAAGAGDEAHCFVTQVCELDEGFGRVIALLVAAGIEVLFGADDVILKFAEGLEGAPGPTGEFLVCFPEHVFGRTLQRLPVVVVERAEEFQCRHLGKGVYERRTVPGNYVKVAASCLDEREEVAAVDTLAVREDGIEVLH